MKTGADGERVIVIDENLAIREGSPTFTTETDRLVIRFLVRKALACRVVATSDTANKYEPKTFRIGGGDALERPEIFKGLVSDERGEEKTSCGERIYPVAQGERQQYLDVDPKQAASARTYVAVDYRFGPFTNDNVVVHLARKDRTLAGKDMAATVTVANHLRYSGWFDVTFGANFTVASTGEVDVIAENGGSMRRLRRESRTTDLDIAVMLKAFAFCSGEGNTTRSFAGLFQPQDLHEAWFCVGIGAGLSLRRPLETFYPVGINLTFGRFVSVHGALSLNVAETFATGYQAGDLFSGSKDDIPTRTRLVGGFGLAVGLDPSLFATLLKAVVTGAK
jgi:hypothetical protein